MCEEVNECFMNRSGFCDFFRLMSSLVGEVSVECLDITFVRIEEGYGLDAYLSEEYGFGAKYCDMPFS